MQLRTLACVSVAMFAIAAVPVRAQEPAGPGDATSQAFAAVLQPGTRVQVHLPDSQPQLSEPWRRQKLRGTLSSVASDTLSLRVEGTIGTLTIPRSSIRRLEVSQGPVSRWRSAAARASHVAAVGALLNLVYQERATRRGASSLFGSRGQAFWTGALAGAALGSVWGYMRPAEQWRTVRLER